MKTPYQFSLSPSPKLDRIVFIPSPLVLTSIHAKRNPFRWGKYTVVMEYPESRKSYGGLTREEAANFITTIKNALAAKVSSGFHYTLGVSISLQAFLPEKQKAEPDKDPYRPY